MVKLTEKQKTIIEFISEGIQNKVIAQECSTTEQVVKNYVRELLNITGLSNRTQLAVWWVKQRFEQEYLDEKRLNSIPA